VSRQANGTYLQPANTAAVSATTISSPAFNTLITDIGTEITNSVDRGGRSAMTAALPMGNQKITGMADPTVSTDATTKNYVDTLFAAFFSTGDLKPTLINAKLEGAQLNFETSTRVNKIRQNNPPRGKGRPKPHRGKIQKSNILNAVARISGPNSRSR
jgi:hypothetical protein